MRRQIAFWTGPRAAVFVAAALLTIPASAWAQRTRGGGEATGTAVPRGNDPAPTAAPAPAPSAPSGSGERASGSGERVNRGSDRGAARNDPAPESARRRDGRPRAGSAIARTAAPPSYGGTIIVPGSNYGYYPWGFGGLGLDEYYGGYYDYYGRYYGTYYDPWYAGYPPYAQSSSYILGYEGSLRLKVKPREAQVFVDGYYAGIVDQFDGIFQRLNVEAGPHRIDVRAPGYETLTVDLQLQPDRTLTYQAELKPIP